MNKTIVGFLAAGILIASLGVGLFFQQRQNSQLTRRFSELENQISSLAEIGAARDAFIESIQTEVAQMSQAQAQLKAEHDAVAAMVAAGNTPGKAPQSGMTQKTNQASVLARLPNLTAEAYRLAARGVGPIQRNPLSGVPVHTLTEAQFLSLPRLLKDQYIAATERRAAMIASERERISANAQFVLEQKLRELGADSATIESARLATKRYDDSLNQVATADAQRRATLAQDNVASAIRSQATAQAIAASAQERAAQAAERQARAIENQQLMPRPAPLQLEPTKVRIVP